MTLRQRIFLQLGGLFVFVFWGLALPFSILYVNADRLQESHLWLDALWLTPLFLTLVVFLPAYRWLQPVARLEESEQPSPALVRLAQSRAERIPVRVVRPILLASGLDALVRSIHLRLASELPVEEVVKLNVLGLFSGTLFGLLAYFALCRLLRPTHERCQRLAPTSVHAPPRLSLFWKTWACLLVAGLIPTSLMGLMSYTISQRQLEASLAAVNQSRLESFARQIAMGRDWHLPFLFPGSETVAIAQRHGGLEVVRGADSDALPLLRDLCLSGPGSGSMVVRRDRSRVLVWHTITSGARLLTAVSVSDYAQVTRNSLKSTLLAAGTTFCLTLLLAGVLARNLAFPVTQLTRLTRGLNQDETMPCWFGDDELGQLGRVLRKLIRQQRDIVRERTRKVEELGTLVSVTGSVRDLRLESVLGELLAQIQEITSAAACSVMLREADRLALKAWRGMDPSHHPRWQQAIQDRRCGSVELEQEGIRTVLSLPLRRHDEVIGQINLFERTEKEFSPGQLQLLERVADHAAVAIENARLYEEKNYISELLYGALIPDETHDFPGLEVGRCYIPSKLLSGDYYDLIPLPDGKVGVVMADVAGKGPDAAIQAVRAKHVIRASALAGYSPTLIVRQLNRMICEEDGRMVTVFYIELDLSGRCFRYVNAGHEPPLFWRAGQSCWETMDGTAVLLGAIDPLECEETTGHLDAGDCLVLFTDGVTEARAAEGEFFGTEPVCRVGRGYVEDHPQALVDAIFAQVHEFSRGRLSDDFSLLALRFL